MPITPLASRPHDHPHCVHSALSEADTLCAQKGLRLTALRKRVLELVWQSHKPLGAYDILAVLSEQDGRRGRLSEQFACRRGVVGAPADGVPRRVQPHGYAAHAGGGQQESGQGVGGITAHSSPRSAPSP